MGAVRAGCSNGRPAIGRMRGLRQMTSMETRCCIVGGGPAGMMLGYLLARQGLDVVVLEKHKDFLRDFRGDTVHPSTLEVLGELGLLDAFLARPHQELRQVKVQIADETFQVGDFGRLKVRCPYIAFMPQWDFLDYIADEARGLPNFRLLMSTEGRELQMTGERVTGVLAEHSGETIAIAAQLVVAADGRRSTL